MEFARNLKRLRLIKKETTADIATALDINEDVYISWEAGQAEPWGEHLYNLAHHFKVPFEVLLDESFDYELYLMILKARGTI
ncbi:helix-turn-helix transcriptional regulator [Anaerovibrio sp. RM50]|uniref:helix-turn-helix transcriptional regulator n=1 Tax=Anaerovibrio sp. RM50 TaxID=1200557 RepID=UPI00056CD8B7|nr:helix-turn-helix transcriptional regulator [Anaerovibrio sp. RM50]